MDKKAKKRSLGLSKTEKRIIICTAAVVLIALSIYPTVTYLVPFIKYSHAVSLMEKGSFDEATAAFEEMGDYKDAPEKIGECAELKEQADGISEKCDALLESVKADEARMSEVSVLRKHLINYAKTKDVFAAYKASGYNREFYEAHRDTLALRSAAKKAFDAYKKENGSDKKLPRISELNAEYAMLLERKKSSYAEYRRTKSEMQDWLVAQKIVQEILKEDEKKKRAAAWIGRRK